MNELDSIGIPDSTQQSSHLSFKKCIIKTNVSTLPFNIKRLIDTMQALHESRVGDTNLSSVLLTILGKKSGLNFCRTKNFAFESIFQKNGALTNHGSTSSLIINKIKSFSN
jgi:hypothetical protein